MITQYPESAVSEPKTLEAIQIHLHCLALEQRQQVLDFVEFLAQKKQPKPSKKTTWEKIYEQMEQFPKEVWEDSPTDGSYQHDHCLHCMSKRES